MMHHDSSRVVLAAARRAARTADRPLLLAVSGGLDSMALLSAMTAVARRRIAAVATFDHGTGAAASRAARRVCQTAAAAGLPVVIGQSKADTIVSEGREAAWREERHRFLGETAARLGARVVTAHTEDDQIETVLMRIMRGSGARGLAGLYAAGPILRPFVEVRHAVLKEYLLAAGVDWVDDPSNVSTEFMRNRARLELLPALRRADPSLESGILSVARRADALRRDVDTFVSVVLQPTMCPNGRLMVASEQLTGYDEDSLAVLWVALAGRAGLALDRRGTERLAVFTSSHPRSGRIPLAGGWFLEASRDTYLLHKPLSLQLSPAARLPVQDGGTLDWGLFRFRVSNSAVPSSLWTASIEGSAVGTVRSWSAGDRLEPAAGQSRRRVTRYLSDVGVRGTDRVGWPVVVAGDDIVWIPGVRRSDAATDRSGRPVRHYVCERIDR